MGAPAKAGSAKRALLPRAPKRAPAKKVAVHEAAADTNLPSTLPSQSAPAPDLGAAPTLSSSAPDAAELDVGAQERAVAAVRATLPSAANREELRKDPIYRIMHALPRSDVLEVVRSRFAAPHCARAAAYFDLSYMKNPLRRLRLQIGCDGPTGMHLFFPRISAHRHTLRVLDLSRNRLGAEDVVLLCNLLGLGTEGSVAAASLKPSAMTGGEEASPSAIAPASSAPLGSVASSSSSAGSCLELVDLSYNTKIGNAGALHVLRALRRCSSIRALMLKSVGVDDSGAAAVSDALLQWPAPAPAAERGAFVASNELSRSTASATKFYLNLNENYIGASGTYLLGKGLPHHVSLTLAKQRLPLGKEQKRERGKAEGSG